MDAVRTPRQAEDAQDGVDRRVRDLLDAYEAAIYRFAYLIVRDPDLAAECTQETFVRAYEHLLWGREINLNWLYVVARSRAVDELRHRKRERQVDPELQGSIPGIASTVEVREALDHLSPDDRAIIYLRRQGLSTEEIAPILGVRLETARKRVTRARQRLKKLLGDVHG